MDRENIVKLIGRLVLTKRKPFLRYSKVRMYYATVEGSGTPTPFAEFRAFLVTQEPGNYERYLDAALDRLEWVFWSVKKSIEDEAAEFEIVGSEYGPEIDPDEVVSTLTTTGYGADSWSVNQIYRYVSFFSRNGEIKKDYDEREISQIEANRSDSYRQWILEMRKKGVWEDRKRARRQKEIERREDELQKRRILRDWI